MEHLGPCLVACLAQPLWSDPNTPRVRCFVPHTLSSGHTRQLLFPKTSNVTPHFHIPLQDFPFCLNAFSLSPPSKSCLPFKVHLGCPVPKAFADSPVGVTHSLLDPHSPFSWGFCFVMPFITVQTASYHLGMALLVANYHVVTTALSCWVIRVMLQMRKSRFRECQCYVLVHTVIKRVWWAMESNSETFSLWNSRESPLQYQKRRVSLKASPTERGQHGRSPMPPVSVGHLSQHTAKGGPEFSQPPPPLTCFQLEITTLNMQWKTF